MAAFSKFNQFVADLANGVHDLQTNTFKFMLTDTAPSATNTVKANITEITAGNGYTAGGATTTVSSSSQTGGLYSWVIGNVSWTASGGSIAQFRYAVLYNSTTVSGNLIAFFDLGSEINVTNGNTFQLVMPAAILTLQ